MNLELRGKKVLITGGSKGIGLACAHAFAAEGARIHIASRNEADLVAFLASARAPYISGTVVTIDCGASLCERA